MSSFLLRFHSIHSRRLPLWALLAASPLGIAPANAQVKTTESTPAVGGQATATPLLTGEVRPASSIATAPRPKATSSRVGTSNWLVASMPDTMAKGTPSSATPIAATPIAATPPQTAAVARVAVAIPTPVSTVTKVLKVRGAATVALRTALSQSQPPARRVEAARVVGPAPRFAAALPARGGLAFSNSTTSLANPAGREDGGAASGATAINDSRRVLLARLDADLAQAQRRLDRAETRLSDGQRQLGTFTNVLQSAIIEAGDDARGLHPFVRVAQRYLGTPYVWGGESARGFDCSGFIMRVMRDLGYKALPHSAAEQFNYGTPIAKGLLKPGDIVFFANTYKPGVSHVGIYLGRGRFIHAANSQVGTIVSHLNEPKWVEKYAGARRLVRVNS
jgi:cell wall-associated NlpC family hydrolase